MNMDDLSAVLAMILTVSLATERCVAILKTAVPWLAYEKQAADGETDLPADQSRRLAVQAVALAASWGIAAFMAGKGVFMPWGLVRAGEVDIAAPILGILGSGGSAFWAQLVQIAGEVKKTAAMRRVEATVDARATVEEAGLVPSTDRRTRLRAQLGAQAPERLDAAVAAP
jgi:hypothetical protein